MSRVGYDFLPFYTAGQFVREGRAKEMYDIDSLRTREREIAAREGLALGDGFGPFWNPPFFALPFAPLSVLPFRSALLVWLSINLAALAVAIVLLCRVLASRGSDWRTWGLVPLLVLASCPFLLAITHGQNTFCSLLLLTLATLAWRSRSGMLAGLAIGLLAYKPQLAAVVGFIALIDLGWKVAAGAIASGTTLVLTAAVTMPGIFETYRTALPRLLRFMQVEHAYMWERHVTLKAFWRLLIQGYAVGETSLLVNVLTFVSAGLLGAGLIFAATRCRHAGAIERDRLITATIATMPLVMPFYFDYDLLLLAIPAVLISRELIAAGGSPRACSLEIPRASARGYYLSVDRALPTFWCLLYLWLIINPDVAELTRVNVAVLLLTGIAMTLTARALRREPETAQLPLTPPAPLAAVA